MAAGHTAGLAAHPAEYEQSVVSFFSRALLGAESRRAKERRA